MLGSFGCLRVWYGFGGSDVDGFNVLEVKLVDLTSNMWIVP